MKKKIIITIVSVIIVVGACLAIFYPGGIVGACMDFGMKLTGGMKHQDFSKEKPAFELTTAALSEAFKADTAAATQKYNIDKPILLEGDITGIEGTTVSFNNVACNMDSSQVSAIATHKVGDKVKIQGRFVGYNDLLEEIDLSQCTFK